MLIVENYVLATTSPDLCTSFLLLLTLPVTVGASDRSFSKLKLIKNYLRSSVGQMRLSGLEIIYIERDRAIKLDASVVKRNFAESKARRKNFDKQHIIYRHLTPKTRILYYTWYIRDIGSRVTMYKINEKCKIKAFISLKIYTLNFFQIILRRGGTLYRSLAPGLDVSFLRHRVYHSIGKYLLSYYLLLTWSCFPWKPPIRRGYERGLFHRILF
jgi:hypothetical protein